MPMHINYQEMLPVALKYMYPDEQKRKEVESLLSMYGAESFHRERERVILGILYLASKEPKRLKAFIEMACVDYRDLLCAAEYPYSSSRWSLRDKDPNKYKRLRAKEESEYLLWIQTVNQA